MGRSLTVHKKLRTALLRVVGIHALPLAIFLMCLTPSAGNAAQISPENRTYGFFMVRTNEYLEDIQATNAGWVRMAGVAAWGLVEAVPGSGVYDFSVTDPIIQEANDRGISLVLTINQVNGLDAGASQKALPSNMAAYKAFVGAFVERYDGDGVNDAPNSPVVRYWQVCNEPDSVTDTGEKVEWNDTPGNYALFLKESANTIRQASPNAVILLAGLAQGLSGLQNFYTPMFAALDGYAGGPFFDAFDVHWFGTALNNDYLGLRNTVDESRNLLTAHGYGSTPIWATETATYSDTPAGWPTQTEVEQARDLAKRLIYFRTLGIDKIFWTPLKEFHEWKGIPNHYFDNTGLINNPQNDGISSEKKAYFTYRLVAGKLDGAIVQFDSLFTQRIAQSVAEGCELSNNGRTYYAIWIDDPVYVGSTVSFPTDYQTFKVYTLSPNGANEIPVEVVQSVNGKFEYIIGMDPILIEYTPIEITYPPAGSSLDTPSIAVEGFVDMGQQVTFVNPPGGSPVTVTGNGVDGSFLFPAQTFPEGVNTIHLSVEHAPGVTSEVLADFTVDTQAPTISSVTVVQDTTNVTGPYAVEATVTDGDQVLNAKLRYAVNGGSVIELTMTSLGGSLFSAEIPGQPLDSNITYNVTARDLASNVATGSSISFRIVDGESPVITNVTTLADTQNTTVPYVVTANVTDNGTISAVTLFYQLNGGSALAANMANQGGGLFRGEIPAQPLNTLVGYWVSANDTYANSAVIPASAPSSPYWFRVIPPGTGGAVVDVAPLTSSIARGRIFNVSSKLDNLNYASQTFKRKIMVTLPSGKKTTLWEVNVPMGPIEHKAETLSHYVPTTAPTGTYTYAAIISNVSGVELIRDTFTFKVTK